MIDTNKDEIITRTIENTKVGDKIYKDGCAYTVVEVHAHYVRCINETKTNSDVKYYHTHPYYECFTLGDLVVLGKEQSGWTDNIEEEEGDDDDDE